MGLDGRRLGLGGLHARPLAQAQAQAHAEGGAGGGGWWRGGRLGLAWGGARPGVGTERALASRVSASGCLGGWGLGARRGARVRLGRLVLVVGWAATYLG